MITTTHAHYLVAYPHYTIPPRKRIKRLGLDSDAVGTELLRLLRDAHPDHAVDLDNATFWKVSRSTVARFPPRSAV